MFLLWEPKLPNYRAGDRQTTVVLYLYQMLLKENIPVRSLIQANVSHLASTRHFVTYAIMWGFSCIEELEERVWGTTQE